MKLIRKILFPIVPIYFLITWLRNKAYDLGIKSSTAFNVPVICVGNLSVGGTGKTPMIEYLIQILKEDYDIATLSRGYKRKTVGFQMANKNSNAADLGDEPYQFHNKFGKIIRVAVDSNRVRGISRLMQLDDPPQVILLDDAFQHRKVKAGLNVLLTTFDNPYFKDIVLPTGDLREPRSGANRANIIVVTKCPLGLTNHDKSEFLKRINPKDGQHVCFSSISYAENILSKSSKINLENLGDFTLVTGIANATPLVSFLKSKNLSFEHLNFKDHHEFSSQDISNLEAKTRILTTEKDFMRLKQYKSLDNKLFYLPIKATIDENEKFDAMVRRFVTSFKQ
ncbi:tetraacyldisaccharide 4'-kinase [Hyunsoonleella flava]|uniref:Tetraacyldisaccharide 4'-kinase n=1 Tax=Hyunsoonleella flava TaxID=2527939 RepID=A0A4Q9FIZ4_9FLAO|nr:tetraacyldisaccharide 4'-kinase [Hyunsoonleella flava]TBN05542.1 tetraacyldisaccharide 4'-kinase [Hyunsoonleella flava]